jgi:16S rRNA (guanine966-N2)-methyltransferase
MRIIAGRFRGRPLSAPKGLTTRPTTDRVREALFQILGNLDDDNVVDVYAGTGALGFEALSRGATHATFVEPDRAAIAAIEKNAEKLGVVSQITLVRLPAEKAHARLERLAPFDLILADPPWPIAQEAALVVGKLFKDLGRPGARVILGHPAKAPVTLPESVGLELVDRRSWGGSGLSFYAFPG